MSKNKKIKIGALSLVVIALPIAVATSCNSLTAEGNQDINLSYKYSDNNFNNFKNVINEKWKYKVGDKFILTLTNKSGKIEVFTILKSKGTLAKDTTFNEMKIFLAK